MPTSVACIQGSLNICSYKGDTLGSPNSNGIKFTVTQNAAPLDLTGASILIEVKKTKKSATVKMSFDSATADIDITDLVNGVFVLNKTAAQMEAIAAFDSYFYDIEITLASGDIFTFVEGLWTHTQDVTG